MFFMNIAIIGTQGVPANYGGFESLVENLLGENCPDGIKYTVFCSSKDMPSKLESYKGAKLKYIPLHANGAQSIPYDVLSFIRTIQGYDVVLVLGVSGCLFLPVYRLFNRKRLIINIDGLEHKRDKWGRLAKFVLRTSEAMAVRYADVIISDNKGIQDYVSDTYGKESELIAYGGDHAQRSLKPEFIDSILNKYGLKVGEYAITVCRIEPENNSHIILESFAKSGKQLVFVGNWNHSQWSRDLKDKYINIPNIKILDAIYDIDVLYALRSNAGIYMHGHSAGGTNPSLVEAMFFGIPIVAYDVVYNRETTENKAYYFNSVNTLLETVNRRDLDGSDMLEIANRRYRWQVVAQQYVNLYK